MNAPEKFEPSKKNLHWRETIPLIKSAGLFLSVGSVPLFTIYPRCALSMNPTTMTCENDKRRRRVREDQSWNGLDYVQVERSKRVLRAYLINKANDALQVVFAAANEKRHRHVVITGGNRAAQVVVEDAVVQHDKDETRDDYLQITLKEPGDFSTYSLRLAALDNGQHPTSEPLPGIDPRYDRLTFNFNTEAASELDCAGPRVCASEKRPLPEINYLAKDYASFRRLILDRLSQIMPGWQERHVPDLGVALVEMLAYVGDHLSYYQDAVATEAYLDTARQRLSVRRHARLVDYPMHEGCNSRTWITVAIGGALLKDRQNISLDPQEIFFTTRIQNRAANGEMLEPKDLQRISPKSYAVFEPLMAEPQVRGFQLEDVKDPASFALKLQEGAEPLAQYIREHMPVQTQELLEKYDGKAAPALELQQALIAALNRLLLALDFYQQPLFTNLSPETQALRKQKPQGEDLMRLQRWLLEEAYPRELAWTARRYLYFFAAHNKIAFYTWGNEECCLAPGATSAFLWDVDFESEERKPAQEHEGNVLQLRIGEVLIFEEVIDPQTGNASDANPQHRHAVRLTKVQRTRDELRNEPLVEIAWEMEDALPFPLCLSTLGPAPECEILRHVSVGRGNVVLADYGRRVDHEFLGRVAVKSEELACVREGRLEDARLVPENFHARLQQGPITYREPITAMLSATKALQQTPSAARPEIKLNCSCLKPGGVEELPWEPRLDLLHSQPEHRHFTVETDNEGRALLRFGDGENGQQPEAGETFTAHYRIGNGAEGNLGAETIAHVVARSTSFNGLHLLPRNPFVGRGGVDSEPIAEVKLYAPTAFRKRLERAITAEDYARLAERDPRVQRAAATQRWNGSWYEILIALDPLSQVRNGEVDRLRAEVEAALQRYRRMGHELVVEAAQYVPLDLRMEVCVLPGYLRGHVKAELLRALGNKKMPDGALGFFHPDNWTFGQAVRLSALYAAGQKISGVESLSITRFQRMFLPEEEPRQTGILPIHSLEIARVDNDPNFPENGRIEFIVKGGR